jgi:hypothetical protein
MEGFSFSISNHGWLQHGAMKIEKAKKIALGLPVDTSRILP